MYGFLCTEISHRFRFVIFEKTRSYNAQCSVGIIAFEKSRVVNLTKASQKKNESLLKKWTRAPKTHATPAEAQSLPTQLIDRDKKKSLALPEEAERARKTVRYNGEWITEEEYAHIKAEKRRSWQDRLREKKESSRTEKRAIMAERAHAETRELIVQGSKRRSNAAHTLLSDGDWNHTRTEHFFVFYRNNTWASLIAEKAEYFFRDIATDLGIEREIDDLDRHIEIYVIDSQEVWDATLRGKYLPDTPFGFSKVYKKEIFLYITHEYDIEFILPHELSHVLLRLYTNRKFGETAPIPLWLYEGFANFHGRVIDLSSSQELLISSIKHASHIPLSELIVMNEYPRRIKYRTLFYAQSTHLIDYIYSGYGRLVFIEFLHAFLREYYEISQSHTALSKRDGKLIFENAMIHSALGKDYSSFTSLEENMLKSIVKK